MRTVIAFICIAAIMYLAWLNFRVVNPPFECHEVAKALEANNAYAEIESWLDQHAHEWDGVKNRSPPRYLFPYGLYTLPVTFDPKEFELRVDAEAQAIVDGHYKLMAVQLTDSRAQKVVINRYPKLWYRWKPINLATVSDRSGVVCSGPD